MIFTLTSDFILVGPHDDYDKEAIFNPYQTAWGLKTVKVSWPMLGLAWMISSS